MLDGLWVIEFNTGVTFGSGVLVFNGDQVMGGDHGYYYSGQINTTGKVTGEINVARYNPNIISVFGDYDNFTLVIKDGTFDQNTFTIKAAVKNAEAISLQRNPAAQIIAATLPSKPKSSDKY